MQAVFLSDGFGRHSRCVIIGVSLIVAWGRAASADDRVLVQRPGQSSRVTVTGQIVDYNGRELVLLTGVGGGEKRFPFDEIREVSTTYNESHQAGRRLLSEGRLEDAWNALAQALDDEDRTWVRREILALQVRCALARGDLKQAASRFLPIVQSDPATVHYRLAPLIWADDPEAAVTISLTDARQWLKESHAPARLIAASWLLNGPERAAARDVLQELASDVEPTVQRLAQAQLWRLRLGAGDLSGEELRRWHEFNESLPPHLRGGPYFLIGAAHAARQERSLAAAAWMWLPIAYNETRYLAAEAQARAYQALAADGDEAGARRLAQDLATKYAGTPQATVASELLK